MRSIVIALLLVLPVSIQTVALQAEAFGDRPLPSGVGLGELFSEPAGFNENQANDTAWLARDAQRNFCFVALPAQDHEQRLTLVAWQDRLISFNLHPVLLI